MLKRRPERLSFCLTDDGLECLVEETQVGYIRVDSQNQVKFVFVHPEFRRRGIGAALYQEMAKQLATTGRKLYASDYQHHNAVAVWNWLRENDNSHFGYSEDGRLYLSYL